MDASMAVPLAASMVALLSAAVTAWVARGNARRAADNAREIELLRRDHARELERTREEAASRKTVSKFSEPLLQSAFDLQSRLFNIARRNFFGRFHAHGNARERSYVVENTTFLVCQYLAWTELVRREIQFLDLGEAERTREVSRRLGAVAHQLTTSSLAPPLRIFAGEQRAIGEALICGAPGDFECAGYGAFLQRFGEGAHPLIDAVRADIVAMTADPAPALPRLIAVQHALVDLIALLDPDHIRLRRDLVSKIGDGDALAEERGSR